MHRIGEHAAVLRHGLGAVLVGALLLTWAGGIGRYGGPDEPAHVLRAFAVADGQLTGERTPALPSGYRVVRAPEALASGDPACYRHDARITSACAAASDGDGRVSVATSAGTYPPLYYALVGVPVRLIGDPADSAWYRFVATALVAVVLACAVWRLRPLGTNAVLLAAAITPAAWFLFGVVNPNGLELALVALAWVGVARWLRVADDAAPPPAPIMAAWIGVPLGIAVAVRPVALMAVVAVLAVVEIGRRPRAVHRVALYAPTMVAAASVAGWSRFVDLDVTDPRTAEPGPIGAALLDSLGGVPGTLHEAVGMLGWREHSAPAGAQLLWIAGVVVGLVAWGGRGRPAKRTIVMWCAWVGVLTVTPVLFEVVLREQLGPIWQGRYSLPTFIGLGALLAARHRVPRPAIVALVVVIAAVVEAWTYAATVRRFAVGSHGSWWLDGAIDSTVGLAPRTWLLVHLAVVAIAVAATLGWLSSLDVAEDVDDHVGAPGEVEHLQPAT